jgi:hypothetical protein
MSTSVNTKRIYWIPQTVADMEQGDFATLLDGANAGTLVMMIYEGRLASVDGRGVSWSHPPEGWKVSIHRTVNIEVVN